MLNERWLPIIGWELLYQVSDIGRVRRIAAGPGARAGHIHKPGNNLQGYRIVNLRKDGKNLSRPIHSLVAAAFIGPRPIGQHVNHIDGDKKNNFLGNLEYCTASKNCLHAFALGLRVAKKGKRKTRSP